MLYYEMNTAANEHLNDTARRTAMPGGFPGDDSMDSPTPPPRSSQRRGVVEAVRERLQQWGAQHGQYQYLPLLNNNSTTTGASFLALSTTSKLIYVLQMAMYIPLVVFQRVALVVFVVLARLFPVVKRLTERYSQGRQGSRSEPKGVDPAQVARYFISDMNTYYGNADRIEFFEGGYTSALFIANRNARFIMVYLHSDEHDDTPEFIQNTLLSPLVLDFIKEHNILVWGGNVSNSEAYQVANAAGATKFPFVGLVALQSKTRETPEGTTASSPKLSVVAKSQGLVSPEKLVSKFAEQVDKLEPTLISIRAERQQQELSRVIREQQDSAYQASLQRDRLIAEQRKLEAIAKKKRLQWLQWRASNLLPEVEATAKGQFARVAIRTTTGERISRRFPKDAPLEEIYAFVELYQCGMVDNFSAVDKPDDFEFHYAFKLISPMPRAELMPSLDAQIKDDPSVWPGGNLIVEMDE